MKTRAAVLHQTGLAAPVFVDRKSGRPPALPPAIRACLEKLIIS
ncbi:MAG: hypothetical protein ACJ76J_15330 [Thermoanaerobaculia bacterium]